MKRQCLASVILLSVCAASAQTTASRSEREIRAKNPPGMEFSLSLLNPRRYREGELIRAEIRFTAHIPSSPQQPPPERWQFAGLLLDPPKICGSLDAPCFQSMMSGFYRSDPSLRLGETSGPLLVSLNNYLPRLTPGSYRAAVLLRKLVLTSRTPMSTTYSYPNPQQYAVSNSVDLQVGAATDAWLRQAIADSVTTLKGPPPNGAAAYELHRTAAEQLQFLDVPSAWSAALALLPAEENILLRGLSGTREPARVCELMQSVIPAPEQAVSSYYLSSMAQICAKASLPPAPPYALPKAGQKPSEPTAEQRQYGKQFSEVQQSVIEKASATLAANLAAKQNEAKAIALQTLIAHVQQAKSGPPAWAPVVKAEFTKSYARIDARWRRQLLGQYAAVFPSPELLPLLDSVLDSWKPGDYYEAPQQALRILHSLDPARAQARIAAELAKEKTWLDAPQLELLPASAARLKDNDLIASLAAAQRPGGWNVMLSMTALAKYASPRALPRIKAIYESQQDPCQPELLAYFVRVDPAYADEVFHKNAWEMHSPAPACTVQYFERTPRLAMGEVLERFLSAYLMHQDVPPKKSAAHALGQFGSPEAVAPLWDSLRYFHQYWTGRQTELQQNFAGVQVELELRNAIARGNRWFASEADLHAIESLCISEQCKYETQQDLRNAEQPLKIEINNQSGEINWRIAQYYGIGQIEAVEEKLSQFPKGTRFAFASYGVGSEQTGARIRQFAASRGLIVSLP